MTQSPIKVLLVEDSAIALSIFRKLLDPAPEVQVVGIAQNGIEALNLIPKLQPQVICTDLKMPKMDGLEFIKQVMAKTPLPILVISDAVQKQDVENVFQVLKAGAVDIMPKPSSVSSANQEELQRSLVTKIRVLASKQVSAKPLS